MDCWITCFQIPQDFLALVQKPQYRHWLPQFIPVEGVGWELGLVSGACCHGSWGSQQ